MYSQTPVRTAKKAALDLLSRSEYGRYELQQKLLNKGFELSDIDSRFLVFNVVFWEVLETV